MSTTVSAIIAGAAAILTAVAVVTVVVCTFGTGIFAVGAGAAGLAAGAGAATGTSGAAVLAVGAGTALGAGLIFGGVAAKIITSNQYNLQFNRITTTVEVIGACVMVGLFVATVAYSAYTCIQNNWRVKHIIKSGNGLPDKIISGNELPEKIIGENDLPAKEIIYIDKRGITKDGLKNIFKQMNLEPYNPSQKSRLFGEGNMEHEKLVSVTFKKGSFTNGNYNYLVTFNYLDGKTPSTVYFMAKPIEPMQYPKNDLIGKTMQYPKSNLIGKSGKYLPEKMRFSDNNPKGLRNNEIFSDDYQIKLFNEKEGITEKDVNNLLKESRLKYDKWGSYEHSVVFKNRNMKDLKLVSVIFKESPLGNENNCVVSFIYWHDYGYELRYVLMHSF